MILPIYVYGMPVLRKVATEIPKDDPTLPDFVRDMFETMLASDGVGLAAPQVGKSLRMFVIDAAEMAEEEEDESLRQFRKAFINPVITEEWGDPEGFREGCISIPYIREEVMRPPNIRIEYYDENWEFHREEYDGVRARIIQHEYDHLNGKLLIDRINPLRRKLLKSKLNAISRGEVDTDYRIIYPKK
ncbi:MAG: peptide deformylase [Bacteroidota bacterium]